MPNKSGLDELVRELGLHSDPSNRDALRSEIKARIAEIHPDTRARNSAERLQLLQRALRRLGKNSTALQTIDSNHSLLRAEVPASSQRESAEDQLKTLKGEQRSLSSRTFLVPKFSLGGVSAAVAWVFLFPRTFADHPLIGKLLRNADATGIWISAVLLLALAWLAVWWLQRRTERQLEVLLSFGEQKRALDWIKSMHPEGFAAAQFQEQLFPRYVWYPNWLRRLSKLVSKRGLSYFTKPTYDAVIADKVTGIALERFLEKGWIVPVPKPEEKSGIDDYYAFT